MISSSASRCCEYRCINDVRAFDECMSLMKMLRRNDVQLSPRSTSASGDLKAV